MQGCSGRRSRSPTTSPTSCCSRATPSTPHAERIGFVNRLTEPGAALDEAIALAARICENGPVAVRETMRVIGDLRTEHEQRGWELTARAEQVIYTAEDTREGVTAFFEKRPPRWTGR